MRLRHKAQDDARGSGMGYSYTRAAVLTDYRYEFMNLQPLQTAIAGGVAAPANPARFTPPQPSAMAQTRERPGILHYMMLAYLFIFCSRLAELIPQVRISLVLLFLLLMAMGLTMRSGAILAMPSGKALILLTAWVGLCVPFSVWPGGSFKLFRDAFQTTLTAAVIAAFIRTIPESLRAMYTVGLAMTFAACLAFVIPNQVEGRLIVGPDDGILGDPNFYCYYVLTGFPFVLLGVSLSSGFKRLAWLSMIGPILYVAARTGSRGGMLAFIAGILFLFWNSSVKQKVYFVLAVAFFVPVAGMVLPETAMRRYVTMFSDEEATNRDTEVAQQSTDGRLHLLIRSLEVTRENPIVGVGPGQFMVAEAAEAKEEGRRGAWHVTHNTYTGFSSEIGIPGACVFLVALGGAIFGLTRIRKHDEDPRIRRMAMMMQMSLIMLSVCAMFLTLGYAGLHYAAITLSGTFQVAVRAHRAQANARIASMPRLS